MANPRPHANLSDAELDRRITHELNALSQNQAQAAYQSAQAGLAGLKQAQIQTTQTAAGLQPVNVKYTPYTITAGTSTAVNLKYYFNPSPGGGGIWTADWMDGVKSEPVESKEDRKLRKQVDKVFSRLHDQVAQELSAA